MEDTILLSIVIPTYNRYQYLEGCLRATCTIDSNEIEIIVQDNSEDNTRGLEIIQSINDNRIKYFHTKERLTVSENCSNAIEKTIGRFICFIGDDDTVCDNIIDLVKEMNQDSIDTCVFGINTYHWPDLLDQKPDLNCFEGVIRTGKVIYENPISIFYKEMENGLQWIDNLPRVYHAIVARDILISIKNKTGSFFPGPSPDMANAMGCALYSKRHINIDVPVMISGYGGKSTGGMGRKHKHRGSLLDKPWLPKNILEIWDKKIPKLWLGHTIWPASAIIALKAMGREDLTKKLNYGVMYAEIILHEKDCFRDVFACDISFREMLVIIKHVIKRIIFKVTKKNTRNKVVFSKERISLIDAKRIQDKENLNLPINALFAKARNQ